MSRFSRKELLTMYDKKTTDYILKNNLNSFKNHCSCGGYIKTPVQHQYWCPQEIEVKK